MTSDLASSKTVTWRDIVTEMGERFTSLNSIPVERATIRRHEWEAVLQKLHDVMPSDETSGGVDAFTWELAKKQLDRLVGLEEELARWKAACTGKHGSQAPCVPPEKPTGQCFIDGCTQSVIAEKKKKCAGNICSVNHE